MIDEDVMHKIEVRGWKWRSFRRMLCDSKGLNNVKGKFESLRPKYP